MNIGQYGLTEESLNDIFNQEEVKKADVLILSEVKLSLGDARFERGVKGWSRQEGLRKDQQHGGVIVYVKNTRGVVHYEWDGLPYEGIIQIGAERSWTMFETSSEKLALSGVYARVCDPTMKYHENNVQLFTHLTQEVLHLQQAGYRVASLGDYNSWLGEDDEYGIVGDVHQRENSNGRLLKNHLRTTGLDVVNRRACCEGGPVTFMDRMGRRSTLDLCLVSENVDVMSMVIDGDLRDKLDIDHVPLRVTLRLRNIKGKPKKIKEQSGWFVSQEANWELYKNTLSNTFSPGDQVDIDDMNTRLCKLLVDTAFSTNVYQKTRKKEERKTRRTLPESVLSRIRLRKEKFARVRELQTRGASEEEQRIVKEEAKEAENEEKRCLQIMRAGKFQKVRELCKKKGREGSKAFWTCVKGVEQVSDPIDVVRTADGLRSADEKVIKEEAERHFSKGK